MGQSRLAGEEFLTADAGLSDPAQVMEVDLTTGQVLVKGQLSHFSEVWGASGRSIGSGLVLVISGTATACVGETVEVSNAVFNIGSFDRHDGVLTSFLEAGTCCRSSGPCR